MPMIERDWKLVPENPTEDMILAGYKALMDWDARTGDDYGIFEIWQAMLLSTPPQAPVSWQPGERELALKWMARLSAKLSTKPDHADDMLWLERLSTLVSTPPVSAGGLVGRYAEWIRKLRTEGRGEVYRWITDDAEKFGAEFASALTAANADRDRLEKERDEANLELVAHRECWGEVVSRAEAAEADRDRLARELEEAREEIEAAKAFGGGFYGDTVTEAVREIYRDGIRSRALAGGNDG